MLKKYHFIHIKRLVIIMILPILFMILPTVQAKAAVSICRYSYNGVIYYLTENQYNQIKVYESKGNYDGALTYLESLGEDAHQFAMEDGTLFGGYFNYENSVKKIVIPNGVQKIGESAFYGLSSLTKVVIPSSVQSIDKYAFYGCSSLTSIKMWSNIKDIGERAFDQCSSLENVITKKGSYVEQYFKNNLDCAIIYTTKPTLQSKSKFLLVGDTYNALVYNRGSNSVSYKSSNSKVAKVDRKGLVKAVSSGTATISATIDGTILKCKITVRKNTEDNRILQFQKNYTKSTMSDYEIVTLAHAWLIQNVKYDQENYLKNTIPVTSHKASGALIKGVAVCDGYSYAFKKMMDSFNIPCQVITGRSGGDGHAWNLVKINNEWYHIDVTYDDPIVDGSDANKVVYTNYFLLNDSQIQVDHSWNAANYEACTATTVDKTYVSAR